MVIRGRKNTSETHLPSNSQIILVQLGILPTMGHSVCITSVSAIFFPENKVVLDDTALPPILSLGDISIPIIIANLDLLGIEMLAT